MRPTLIKIGDHYLVNPYQIVCINSKENYIFLSGTRYIKISDEDLQKVLEYFITLEVESYGKEEKSSAL